MKLSRSFSFETGPASPRTTAIGLAFAASILLALAVFVGKISYEMSSTGLKVEGVVVEIDETRDGMYNAIFQFADTNGQVYRVRDGMRSSSINYEIGQKVPLTYIQGDPFSARKDSAVSIYMGPIGLALMSLCFYIGAALVWRYRSRFQKDYEARRGRTIVTTVNADGTVTQTVHSSAPVFRWTGMFLAALGLAAWLGAIWVSLRGFGTDVQPLLFGFAIFLAVAGALLFLGAATCFRHAKYLGDLQINAGEERSP